MAEASPTSTGGSEGAGGAPAKPSSQDGPQIQARRRVNKTVLLIGSLMAVAVAAAVFFTFTFVEEERKRDIQAWQIRLGIVADSRAAAVNEWIEQNFGHMRELAQNASLQLYMTELAQAQGDASAVTDEAAQASYLRNLLVATAERTGFKAPTPSAEIAANVEIAGVAGIGLVDATGKPIVSTPGMPQMSARIRAAVTKALDGDPALIDVYIGANNMPAIGFVLPVYGVQDNPQGSKGIGAVIGIRPFGDDLFQRLKQPGETARAAETYLIRKVGGTVEFLSPLADGTVPLKRALAIDTPDLAEAYAIDKPGGFALKRDYVAEEVLVTSRTLGNVSWVLVRKVARAEALAETDARRNTLLTVFALLIVGVTVTIVAVWRHGSSLRATQAAENYRVAAERFENMSKFMRVVTNSQPTHIVAVDGETRYTFANEPAAKDAGITPADMTGKTMASMIGPVRAKVYAEINKNVLKEFKPESHLHTFGEDGEDGFQVVRSNHVPLRGDRDYPPAVLMVVDDITELTKERRRSEQMLRELINTLVSVVDRRDPYSANHSAWVALVANAVAREMGVPEIEVKTVDVASRLMNLGKIFIPPELLTRAGNLSPEERGLIANSYLVSVDLLEGVTFDGPVVETIRQMGETWDGKGPLGLKEEEILRTARILAVANAFVGMISPRAYRLAMTFEEVSDILLKQAQTRFDRKPVTALLNYIENRGGAVEWAHFRANLAVGAEDDAVSPESIADAPAAVVAEAALVER